MGKRRRNFAANEKLSLEKSDSGPGQMWWCHLCKINFEDCNSMGMHIMKKHRPSSKYYEGDEEVNPPDSDEYFEDSPVFNMSPTAPEASENVSNNDIESSNSSGDFVLPVSSKAMHKKAKQARSSGPIVVSVSSHQVSGKKSRNHMKSSKFASSLLLSPEATSIGTVQASSSSEKVLYNQILQNITAQCDSNNAQEKGPPKFDYNVENILKWQEKFQNQFASLKYPWPFKVLVTMKVVRGILGTFCEKSKDGEAISATKEIIGQIDVILKRHENIQIQ